MSGLDWTIFLSPGLHVLRTILTVQRNTAGMAKDRELCPYADSSL